MKYIHLNSKGSPDLWVKPLIQNITLKKQIVQAEKDFKTLSVSNVLKEIKYCTHERILRCYTLYIARKLKSTLRDWINNSGNEKFKGMFDRESLENFPESRAKQNKMEKII